MLRTIFAPLVLGLLLASSGCATNRDTGLLTGGALGAGTGALIGSQLGSTGAGAAVGGAVGALSGALIGDSVDQVERRAEARLAAATTPPPNPLRVEEVVQMAQSGVAEETITASIRSSGSTFRLSAADIVNLHHSGVSDRVIQTMIDTQRQSAVVVRSRPVVYERPVYYDHHPVIVLGHAHHHHCW